MGRKKELSGIKGLTIQEKLFVDEFLVDLNLTQAAKRAGCPPSSAHTYGCGFLKKHEIKEAIMKKLNERAERTEVTADRVIYELAVIAFSDVRDYMVDANGSLTMVDEVLADKARAVQSVKQKYFYDRHGNVAGGETEIKLWSKTAALEMLGRHLAMFVDRKEHTGKDGGPIETTGVLTEEMAEQIKLKVLGIAQGNVVHENPKQLKKNALDVVKRITSKKSDVKRSK